MDMLYRVTVEGAIRHDCVGDSEIPLRKNDLCILTGNRFEDCGRISSIGPVPEGTDTSEMPRIKRQATLVDQGKAHENQVRGKSLQRTCDKLIQKHRLPMTLRHTHLTYDRSLVIFVYTAPGRVDFRALLKDLNNALHMRVELRQIGPRDQAAMAGGLGPCGRELCCASFLTNFVSINIKMAKTQGVSLNPSTIIGACGRLKCCLRYEYEGYRILNKSLPGLGCQCCYDGCTGKVIDANALLQTARLSFDNGERVVTVPVSEIEPAK